MVSAGLHCSFRMSRQMLPLLLMLGWYTLVVKFTCRQVMGHQLAGVQAWLRPHKGRGPKTSGLPQGPPQVHPGQVTLQSARLPSGRWLAVPG